MTASQPKPNRTRSIAWKTAIALTCLHGSTACASHTETTREDLSNLMLVETEYLPPQAFIYTTEHLCKTTTGRRHRIEIHGMIGSPDATDKQMSIVTAISIDEKPIHNSTLVAVNNSFPFDAEQVRPYMHCGPDNIQLRIPYVKTRKGEVVNGAVQFYLTYDGEISLVNED